MSVSARLAELGIELPAVAAPVASYIPAVRTGNLIFTSGQLPMKSGQVVAQGTVGDDAAAVPQHVAANAARVCALNAIAAAADLAGGVDNLVGVVKVVGFVASEPGFNDQPAVVNGASELLSEIFGSAHARSAVGVSALPLNVPVEVEVIFEVADHSS